MPLHAHTALMRDGHAWHHHMGALVPCARFAPHAGARPHCTHVSWPAMPGATTQGPGVCDHNPYERCANCVTSAPFVMVGVHAFRKRTTLDGKVGEARQCVCECAFTCALTCMHVHVGMHARARTQHRLEHVSMLMQVWGASLMGVGMASCGFHASTGRWRTLGRRLDYW